MNKGYKQKTKRNKQKRIMKENNNFNLIEIGFIYMLSDS